MSSRHFVNPDPYLLSFKIYQEADKDPLLDILIRLNMK